MKILLIFAAILLLGAALIASLQAQDRGTKSCPIYNTSGQPLPQTGSGYFPCNLESWLPSDPAADDITMVQIGTLVAPMYNAMAGGDSDQDSLFETYMYIKDNVGGWSFTYRIYENDGFDNYSQAFQSSAGLIPYAYGDQDNDGLPEVIGQWSSWVYAYESPAAGRLATQMVWQSPAIINVTGYTAIGDLDQDGWGEIIHTSNSFGSDNRLIIWENIANNQYQEIVNQVVSNNNLGTKAVADFDGDGLMEIAFSSGGGDVYVYESTGNNGVRQIFHGSMNTWNAYACSYANDMDGNGRPEFICSGSDGSRGWVNQIYEAAGNDSFVVRQEIVIWDNYFGVPGNAVGDLDHDAVDEFVIQTAQALHLYKWNGSTYALEAVIPEDFGSILHGVFAYDGNHNGWDELFWLGIGDGGYWTNNTILLENAQAVTPPNISITMTPINPPIIIPPAGGSFEYNVTITNNEAAAETFEGWINAEVPGGGIYNPILGPIPFTLPAGAALARQRTQPVPGSAPAGNYIYIGLVGDYPSSIYDSSYFDFTKSGISTGGGYSNGWTSASNGFDGLKTSSPESFEMLTVNPNPFNSSTTLGFTLAQAGHVNLRVYDLSGREVASLLDDYREAGSYDETFNASGLAAGVYLYKFSTDNLAASGKMIYLK